MSGAPIVNTPSLNKLWIIGRWYDLLLIIGPPFLILPLLVIAKRLFHAEDMSLYFLAFFATGHHLPGMMRAYGDRNLFRRFRIRFTVAPVLLLAVCLLFAVGDIQGLLLITVLWGFWHAAMQVYGFSRIYDAKVRSFDPLTGQIDLMLCLSWFGMAVLCSPGRKLEYLKIWLLAGGTLSDGRILSWLTAAGWIAVTLSTAAFAANVTRQLVRKQPLNPGKFMVLGSSIGFWWYAMVVLNDAILGIALFEIFHDIQYLAIVWVYNRQQVQRDDSIGGFSRLLFRRSMLAIYVALVWCYGFLGLAPESIDIPLLKRLLLGTGIASLLLHFYYDGFIWKVREKTVRAGFGVQDASAGIASAGQTNASAGWLVHGLKWMLFLVPVSIMLLAQRTGADLTVAEHRKLAAIVPDSWQAQFELAIRLEDAEEAIRHFEYALKIREDVAEIHYGLGNVYLRTGDYKPARRHFQRAVVIDPSHAESFSNLGATLFLQGMHSIAEASLRRALELDRNNVEAYYNLGMCLFERGKISQAVSAMEQGLEVATRTGREDFLPSLRSALETFEASAGSTED